MNSYINTNIISATTSNYIITGTGSSIYDCSLGGLGLMYTHRRIGAVRYLSTDKLYKCNSYDLPIFVSDKGRAFVFLTSKTGQEYKKYLK